MCRYAHLKRCIGTGLEWVDYKVEKWHSESLLVQVHSIRPRSEIRGTTKNYLRRGLNMWRQRGEMKSRRQNADGMSLIILRVNKNLACRNIWRTEKKTEGRMLARRSFWFKFWFKLWWRRYDVPRVFVWALPYAFCQCCQKTQNIADGHMAAPHLNIQTAHLPLFEHRCQVPPL